MSQSYSTNDRAPDGFIASEARIHACSIAAIIAVTVVVIGATRVGGDAFGSAAISTWLFAVAALAALAALAVAGLIADRLWRASPRDQDSGTPMEPVADPIAGLLAPYRTNDDKVEAALRLEQVGHIFRQLDVMMAFTVLNAIMVAVAIWGEADVWLLCAWLAMVGAGAAGVIRVRARQKMRAPPTRVSKRALRRISAHSGWRGLAWGAAFALFFADAGLGGKLILGSVSVGMLAGGVLALAPIPSAAILYGLGVMVPTILRLVSFGNVDLAILAMFGVTYSGSMMIVAYQSYYNFATNLTARRAQAEQAATISMLLREFEESASDWLWEADQDGRLTRLPERVAGLFASPLSSEGRLPTLAEMAGADDNAALDIVDEALAARKPFRDAVIKLVDRNGGAHHIALTGSPRPDGGYRGVGSDITAQAVARAERRQALERAEQAEQRLKDGIASVGSGFMLTDSSNRIRLANQGFYEIFSSAPLLGEAPSIDAVIEAQVRLWNATARDRTRDWSESIRSALTSAPIPADIELPTGRWIRVKCASTTEGGTVMLLTDVTDIKQQEVLLAEQAKKLAASNLELEQFAAVASHDLQEPLRKIEAFGQRLGQRTKGSLDEESAYFLDRMMAASGRMRVLITDLLSYSRVGRREGQHRAIDLDRLLAEVLDDLAMAVSERKATVKAERLGLVMGEPTQLRQLFQNLLSNSFKFAKPGSPPTIEITRGEGPRGSIEIRFKDNGIGFDMQHHDKIFEIFHRLHGREQYEGTGIGLATCRKIVERHGGKLSAVSAPGQGATFIALLPSSHPGSPTAGDTEGRSAA